MTGNQLENIISTILFDDLPPPYFRDKLFETFQITVVWNDHTKDVFKLSWVHCLDDSTSKWNNKLTFPGWMFVPRKTNPKRNDYHTTCCR